MPRTESVGRVARRRYWRLADAQAMVDAWRRSGESLAAFCRRHGLQARRVARWAKRLPAEALRFHPVQLLTEQRRTSEWGLEVELADRTTVRLPTGFALEDLRRVLSALDERA